MTTVDKKPATIADAAVRKIALVQDYLSELSAMFGKTAPEYVETLSTWNRALSQAIGFAECDGNLHASSDLSFGVSTSYGLYLGVIFFRDRRFDDAVVSYWTDRRPWNTAHYCLSHALPYPNEQCRDTDERCITAEVPVPGTWSLHS